MNCSRKKISNAYIQIFSLWFLDLLTRIPKLPGDDIWLLANLYISDPYTDKPDARVHLLPNDKKGKR